MHHKNGRKILGVSAEELRRNGGAYVAPRREKTGEIVLVGVTDEFQTAGWMDATSVVLDSSSTDIPAE